jgi:hypothetical protein
MGVVQVVQLKNWAGRYSVDSLHGHKGCVRCVRLLPDHNLLVTGA